MNILGIDYGKKRIGLAWVQIGLGVVLPYGVVESAQDVVDLAKKEGIDKIIIGLPIGLDGKENENTKVVRDFGDELGKNLEVSVEFTDERFSSKLADRMGDDLPRRGSSASLRNRGKRVKAGGVSRDERAAMVILQSFIDKQ